LDIRKISENFDLVGAAGVFAQPGVDLVVRQVEVFQGLPKKKISNKKFSFFKRSSTYIKPEV
jgi:hypothetical protein